MLGIDDALNLGEAFAASLLPAVEGVPAEITRARRNAVGVETGVLVERDEVRRVRGTENMTTVATVVSTQEDSKRRATGGRVAVGRCLVGLRQ